MLQTPTPNALLLVYSEPGDQVPEAEFHDWYDTEHVPLRQAIPGFQSFIRLKQLDDEKKPTWAAIYDVDSLDVLKSGPYAALATTRSEREKALLSKIGLLDRRLFIRNEKASRRVKPGFLGLRPGNVVVLVLFDNDPALDDELHRWYEDEHITLLQQVPGWLLSDRYYLEDSTIQGTDPSLIPKGAQKVLALHYYESPEDLVREEYKKAITTPWMDRIMPQLRNTSIEVFAVYKTF